MSRASGSTEVNTPFAVVIPAGGRSVRFGSDKLLARLGDKSVIGHSVSAFVARPDVVRVVIAAHSPAQIADRLAADGVDLSRVVFCPGGTNRAQSVLNGLVAVDGVCEWAAIHDAARPLVSQDLIDCVLSAAFEHGAAGPATAVHLTIKQVDSPLPAKVVRTVPRHDLFAMQTPQVARLADLLVAVERCPIPLERVTDDLQLLELVGRETWLVEGEPRNLKITTVDDLAIAASLLTGRP